MSRKAFSLGCLSGGSLYFFTQVGEFSSHAEAVAHFERLPRIDRERTVTVERVPCVRHGVEFGCRHIVRDLAGKELNG